MGTFDRYQLDQINLAEQHGVQDTICAKHPNWGPTLMNVCWNRERAHEDMGPFMKTVKFLTTWFPSENGHIMDDLETICYVLDCYIAGREPVLPKTARLKQYDFLRIQDKALADGARVLESNRVSVEETGLWELPVLMAEGDEIALGILKQLEAFSAARKANANQQFNTIPVLLELDDMNIRGAQVRYALDYSDGSIQVLYELIRDRSEDLCKYVNERAYAACWPVGILQIAVTNGASSKYSDRKGPGIAIFESFLSKPCEVKTRSMEPDYASLDILDGVGLDEAVRVVTARGFKEIRSFDKLPMFQDWQKGEEPSRYMLFYHSGTEDYVVVKSGKPSNACYGGMSLYMHRASDMPSGFCSNGPHDGQPGRYYEYTHHDGLFREWDGTGRYIPEGGYDWSKIGFGLFGIPVPEYFTLPFISSEELYGTLSGNPGLANAMAGHGSIYFTTLVNDILCLYDDVLMSSEYNSRYRELYRDWFRGNGLFYAMGWYGTMSNVSELVCGEALSWLRVPPDVFRDWIADGPRHGWQGGGFEVVSRLEDRLRRGTFCLVADAYKLPDPRELPVKLPWLE